MAMKSGAIMSVGKVLLAIVGGIIIGCLTIGGCVYSGYNRAISLDEQVNNLAVSMDAAHD